MLCSQFSTRYHKKAFCLDLSVLFRPETSKSGGKLLTLFGGSFGNMLCMCHVLGASLKCYTATFLFDILTRNQKYTSGMWSSLSLALSSSTWVDEACVGSLDVLADSANCDPIPSVGVDPVVWDSLTSRTLLWNILPPTLISWHQHQHQHQHQQHPD